MHIEIERRQIEEIKKRKGRRRKLCGVSGDTYL
jgi:hypothetical protein